MDRQDLQSSYPIDRMRQRLVYIRINTATVAMLRASAAITRKTEARFCGGFSKLGNTPAGGKPAGPFKSVCNAA